MEAYDKTGKDCEIGPKEKYERIQRRRTRETRRLTRYKDNERKLMQRLDAEDT